MVEVADDSRASIVPYHSYEAQRQPWFYTPAVSQEYTSNIFLRFRDVSEYDALTIFAGLARHLCDQCISYSGMAMAYK